MKHALWSTFVAVVIVTVIAVSLFAIAYWFGPTAAFLTLVAFVLWEYYQRLKQ